MVQISKAFEVSVDYLIRGKKNVTINKIKNLELLHKIEEINRLPEEDQHTIISFLDAFIKRRKFEKLVNGANFKTIKKRHTGESRSPKKSRKYWILVFAGTTTTDF